ncbi:hypothetical protein AO057_08070 [Curvibacter sp. PAE-UM]|nr:hypothetical protein AO057_08070 [Curvibacter sp. PAE-UM]
MFSVLRLVPWGEVIRNAPKVAEGAKDLWGKVSGRPAAPPPPPVDDKVQGQLQAEAHAIAKLRSELQAIGTAVAELQAQMLAATELINDLADQNAQLVQGVETLRRRLAWLAGAAVLLGGAAVAALLLLRG